MNVRFRKSFYQEQENGGEGGSGGGGGGSGGGTETEEQKAARLAAEEEEKKKSKKNPTDEEARLLKESMQRKEKIGQLETELNSLKELKSQLDSLGGMDALKGLVDARKAAEIKALEDKGEWERLRERLVGEHKAEKKTWEEKVAEAMTSVSKLQSQLVEATIGSEFSASNFIKNDLLLTPSKARQIYGTHFEFENGVVVGYDKPRGSANRTALINSDGVPVNFEAAIQKIIDADPEKDHLLRSKAKPGADSRSSRNGVETTPRHATPRDRISAGVGDLLKQANQKPF